MKASISLISKYDSFCFEVIFIFALKGVQQENALPGIVNILHILLFKLSSLLNIDHW